MSNADKGYLLPSNPIVDEDLACTIVWYPDRDEYRRALLGSLHYLATWLAWERDTAHGGTIAAQAWKQANDLTMECWQMACLEQLQTDVAIIKSILANAVFCCDSVTYGPPTVVDPPFTPGSGDPPTTYGETSITTWDEWTEHACYNANRYVDFLIQQAESFASASQTSAYTIGLVAAGLALLSFTGIGLPISFAIASTALYALLQAGSGIFDDVADDIEAARSEIVCAIILGDSLEDAVGAAIGTSSLAWTALYSHVDYGSASSIIQQGGYGDEYLPADTDDTCNCEDVGTETSYYAIPYTGAQCNSPGSRIPASGGMFTGIWYTNTGFCTDLNYAGGVARVRFYNQAGSPVNASIILKMTGHSTSGLDQQAYPAAMYAQRVDGTAQLSVTHAAFVDGQEYAVLNCHYAYFISGEGAPAPVIQYKPYIP